MEEFARSLIFILDKANILFYVCSNIADQVMDETYQNNRPPPLEVPYRVGRPAASAKVSGVTTPVAFVNP